MRSQNIVIFSSGVSDASGLLGVVKAELQKRGHQCAIWRDLFGTANNMDQIALLPMLVKKIPTFDFAVLICEGHDETVMLRAGERIFEKTMRDNVLFETGLCVMALGQDRVILLSDGGVRLPEDLQGIGGATAVHVFPYRAGDVNTYSDASAKMGDYIQEVGQRDNLIPSLNSVDAYIRGHYNHLSPTVIGAAVSTASGYVSNFVLRLLEKCDQGFQLQGDPAGTLTHYRDEDIFLHIVLPEEYSSDTPKRAQAKQAGLLLGSVPTARSRKVEFRYLTEGDQLHIYDYPTTLVTSYQTAHMILGLEADDRSDPQAEKRFNAKELDLFECTLKALLQDAFIDDAVRHFYEDDTVEEENRMIRRLVGMMENVIIERVNY